MHLNAGKASVWRKRSGAAVQRAESCPAPEVLKPELTLSALCEAAAAAARAAARALTGILPPMLIGSFQTLRSVKSLFTFLPALIPVPYFWIVNVAF